MDVRLNELSLLKYCVFDSRGRALGDTAGASDTHALKD